VSALRATLLAGAGLLAACAEPAVTWTEAERAQVAAMSLSRLPAPPPDASNAVADDPRAAALGKRLFSDAALSANGKVACATCHDPTRAFSDSLPRGRGIGEDARNTPSLLVVAWSPWQFWDGRSDSLWSQPSGPLFDPAEMGATPEHVARVVTSAYAAEYTELFGKPTADPMRVVANAGKALAAFERTLRPQPGRFDAFAGALGADPDSAATLLTASEQRGLKLFLGAGQCLRCHHGPLLTNQGFHNTGLGPRAGATEEDRGRADGLPLALASKLNCAGPYSDAPAGACPHLDFARAGGAEWLGAYKTPSLRNVGTTAPYMHDGRLATLREVLVHYNRAPGVAREHGHTELFPLGLDEPALSDLEAFLHTLGPAPAGAS
jgi:cytochrome c peroxidase